MPNGNVMNSGLRALASPIHQSNTARPRCGEKIGVSASVSSAGGSGLLGFDPVLQRRGLGVAVERGPVVHETPGQRAIVDCVADVELADAAHCD